MRRPTNKGPGRTAVEGDAKTLESLLSSSVPDLQVDKAVANSDVTCAKVGSNGGLVPDKSLNSV